MNLVDFDSAKICGIDNVLLLSFSERCHYDWKKGCFSSRDKPVLFKLQKM